MRVSIFSVILVLFSACAAPLPAQISGCTDPLASNYNPQATQNDGSCTYAATNYVPALHSLLGDTLRENSALLYFEASLWTINDGGNGSFLYRLSTDSPTQILQRIYLPACPNQDWEALAQNSGRVFIGDFGNNNGTRQDLRIYAIDKSDLLALASSYPQTDTFFTSVDTLRFAYADQMSFANAPNANNFDCEAFIFYRDSLHLFTKGWTNNYVKHYRLPLPTANDTATFAAAVVDSFLAGYLVTDASVDSATGNLVLVGYNGSTGACSAHLLYGYAESAFFSANRRRLSLPSALQMAQLEGVALTSATEGYMSGERFARAGFDIAPRLFRFDFSAFYYTSPISVQHLPMQGSFVAFPNPVGKGSRSISLLISEKAQTSPLSESLRFDWYGLDGRWLAGGAFDARAESAEIPLPLSSGQQQLLLKISGGGRVLAMLSVLKL